MRDAIQVVVLGGKTFNEMCGVCNRQNARARVFGGACVATESSLSTGPVAGASSS